jgi:predicted nucleic acid-binding protein
MAARRDGARNASECSRVGPWSGESAVLSWALAHRPARAIIDDLSGRRCAEAHGIPLRGTLGIVLLAKVRRQIPSARAMLAELRKAGMYLSDRVVDAALAEIGE